MVCMNIINENTLEVLNQNYKIYFPYEEISIYTRNFKLDDDAIPVIAKHFQLEGMFSPTRLMFRSLHIQTGFPPDEIKTLFDFKRENPKVNVKQLEILYQKNLLAKFQWYEFLDSKILSWKNLLSLCNRLIERSATDNYVFLRFSPSDGETLELITN